MPEVSAKKYSTVPERSEPVTAVMLIALSLIAAGAETNAAGFGVGGLVSFWVVAFDQLIQ